MISPLGTNQTIGKIENERLIHRLIFSSGSMSRSEISKHTGLTEASVSLITSKLLEDGILKEIPDPGEEGKRNRRGRKRKLLTINSDYAYFLGIDMGPYQSSLCLMNPNGKIMASKSYDFHLSDYESLKAQIEAFTADFLSSLKPENRNKIIAAGAAVPARVSRSRGVLADPRFGAEERPLVKDISEAVGFPITLVNNVKARAIEHALYQAMPTHETFLYLYISYGLACQYAGFDSQGRLLLPGDGEVGRFAVSLGSEMPLSFETLEDWVTEPALLRRLKEAGAIEDPGIDSFDGLLDMLARQEIGGKGEGILREAVRQTARVLALLDGFISPCRIFVAARLYKIERFRLYLAECLAELGLEKERLETHLCFSESSGLEGSRGAAAAALLWQYLRSGT